VAELAVAKTTTIAGFARRHAEPRPTFPDRLPRERVAIDPPTACACYGGNRLRKLSKDVTHPLESIPGSGRSSRPCGKSSPAAIAIRSARRTPRFWGAVCLALSPILTALECHVFSAERGSMAMMRLSLSSPSARPILLDFGLMSPTTNPSVEQTHRRRCSTIREIETANIRRRTSPNWSGIYQGDVVSDYGRLYTPGRKPGQIRQAGCWSTRRRLFINADLQETA